MDSLTILAVETDDNDLIALEKTGNDEARFDIITRLFADHYGNAPHYMACAGGRVNLIGEHVDYPDVQFGGDDSVHLFSMGGAIQNNYIAWH